MKRHVRIALKARNLSGFEEWPCEVCGRMGLTMNMDCHHIEPKGMGGRAGADTVENLILLCRSCHSKAHGSPPLDAGMLRDHVEAVLDAVINRAITAE